MCANFGFGTLASHPVSLRQAGVDFHVLDRKPVRFGARAGAAATVRVHALPHLVGLAPLALPVAFGFGLPPQKTRAKLPLAISGTLTLVCEAT